MEQTKSLAIWTDGGARGNPGPAAIGVRIAEIGPDQAAKPQVLADISRPIGLTTNNQAEYRALLAGLEWLASYLAEGGLPANQTNLSLYTDSELMAYQIQGKYKVKNSELRPLYDSIMKLLQPYPVWSITPIRREYNQVADKLVNQALDTPQTAEVHHV